MRNAKEELLSILGNEEIKCGKIGFNTDGEDYDKNIILKINHCGGCLNKFVEKLNLNYYYPCNGELELFGVIWLKNGYWLERRIINNDEHWVYMKPPEIPKELFCKCSVD